MTLKKKAEAVAIEILEELLEKNCEPPKTNCGGRTMSKKSEAVALEILEELLEKNWRLLGQLMLVREELEDLKELRLAAAEALQLLRDVQYGLDSCEGEMEMSIRRLQAILNVYAD